MISPGTHSGAGQDREPRLLTSRPAGLLFPPRPLATLPPRLQLSVGQVLMRRKGRAACSPVGVAVVANVVSTGHYILVQKRDLLQ